MKLLLFSDLHCDANAAANLCERAGDFDLLIGAGDFASARRGLEITIPFFGEIQTPCVFVPGNNESYDELRAACADFSNVQVLHGDSCEIADQTIFGLGGGVPPTPFGDWSFDLSEQEAAQKLQFCPPNAILISHSPPFETLDISSSGKNLGSRAVAQCMAQKSPKLLVCGHIHASAGRQKRIGQTLVVNAGPGGIALEI